MRVATITGIVILVFLLAGGGIYLATRDNSTSNKNTDTQMNMKQSANDSSAPVATDTVAIKGFAFSPANITVKKGATVTWTNQDTAAHTVTENDSQIGPNSGPLAKDQSYSFTFNTVGTFKYHCTFHSEMVGTVTVTE